MASSSQTGFLPNQTLDQMGLRVFCLQVADSIEFPAGTQTMDAHLLDAAHALKTIAVEHTAGQLSIAEGREQVRLVLEQLVLHLGGWDVFVEAELPFFLSELLVGLKNTLRYLADPEALVQRSDELAVELRRIFNYSQAQAKHEVSAHMALPFGRSTGRRAISRLRSPRRVISLSCRRARRREHRASSTTRSPASASTGDSSGPSDPDPAPSYDGNDPSHLAAFIQGIIRLLRVEGRRSPFHHSHQENFHQGTGGRS